jgi:nucleotide-binding universal stress UspA family protein
MSAEVDPATRRAALKTLFSDPRFNVMDGLDTYIDDYTKAEPFTEGLLARIEEVREKLLAPPPAETERGEQEGKPSEGELAAEPAEKNVDSAQDPKAL